MPTVVKHFITCGGVQLELTYAESAKVSKGELSRGFLATLRARGLPIPPRGSVDYFHEIHFNPPALVQTAPGKYELKAVIKTQSYMRRLPEWEQRGAA